MPKTTSRGTAKKSEAEHAEEVAREGAADVLEGSRCRRRAIRRGRAGASRRLQRGEAQLREGGGPLGAEGPEGSIRFACSQRWAEPVRDLGGGCRRQRVERI